MQMCTWSAPKWGRKRPRVAGAEGCRASRSGTWAMNQALKERLHTSSTPCSSCFAAAYTKVFFSVRKEAVANYLT